MEKTGADWTCTFSALTSTGSKRDLVEKICSFCTGNCLRSEWEAWLDRYIDIVSMEASSWDGASAGRLLAMSAVNPQVVPRQWLLKRAEDAAESSNHEELRQILNLLTRPCEAPDNPADTLPSPPLAANIDPTMLGPMGHKAVELLEDADF